MKIGHYSINPKGKKMKEHLYEKNEHCQKCRWHKDYVCQNISSEFYGCELEYLNTKKCEHYYPENEMEIYDVNSDDDTESLFD